KSNKNNADFIIPTDSDADRFALTETDITGSTQTGWRILTGNQLGALLVKDFTTIDTLTGFKWLENISHQLLSDKKHVLFGFEDENTPVHRSESYLDADENQPKDSKDEEYIHPKI
ncbi:unnamed protein product, partial [Rotaria sp. Silwood1]